MCKRYRTTKSYSRVESFSHEGRSVTNYPVTIVINPDNWDGAICPVRAGKSAARATNGRSRAQKSRSCHIKSAIGGDYDSMSYVTIWTFALRLLWAPSKTCGTSDDFARRKSGLWHERRFCAVGGPDRTLSSLTGRLATSDK